MLEKWKWQLSILSADIAKLKLYVKSYRFYDLGLDTGIVSREQICCINGQHFIYIISLLQFGNSISIKMKIILTEIYIHSDFVYSEILKNNRMVMSACKRRIRLH